MYLESIWKRIDGILLLYRAVVIKVFYLTKFNNVVKSSFKYLYPFHLVIILKISSYSNSDHISTALYFTYLPCSYILSHAKHVVQRLLYTYIVINEKNDALKIDDQKYIIVDLFVVIVDNNSTKLLLFVDEFLLFQANVITWIYLILNYKN